MNIKTTSLKNLELFEGCATTSNTMDEVKVLSVKSKMREVIFEWTYSSAGRETRANRLRSL